MKKKLLEALKARFDGVNESILSRIADKLAKTVTKEEDVDTTVESMTLQQVIDSEADRRATEASQTAVANYEKRHSLKEGKPVDGGEQVKEGNPAGGDGGGDLKGGDLADRISEAVKAAVNPLMQEIETLKSGKVSDARKQQLDDVIANTSDKFKTRITNSYKRMNFKDDEDFNAFLEEIKTEAEDDEADTRSTGAVFGRPKVGQQAPKDEVPKHIQEYFDGKGKDEGQNF